MPSPLPTTCRWLHLPLALLVVAALADCSWEEGREAARWSQTITAQRLGLPAPIHAPVHDCSHESGCICRGATLVQAVAAAGFPAGQGQYLPAEFGVAAAGTGLESLAARGGWPDADTARLPISGRQLRALYASLVI